MPYTFYDVVHVGTDKDSFVHKRVPRGFGTGSGCGGWPSCCSTGDARPGTASAPSGRGRGRRRLPLSGLAAAVVLAAFTLSAITSTPFHLNDATFVFGVLTGLGSGAYSRLALAPTGSA